MNEPAFPNDSTNPLHSGMTLRDYFAAAALTGPIANCPDFRGDDYKTQCEWAYRYADAMLAQRNKK